MPSKWYSQPFLSHPSLTWHITILDLGLLSGKYLVFTQQSQLKENLLAKNIGRNMYNIRQINNSLLDKARTF